LPGWAPQTIAKCVEPAQTQPTFGRKPEPTAHKKKRSTPGIASTYNKMSTRACYRHAKRKIQLSSLDHNSRKAVASARITVPTIVQRACGNASGMQITIPISNITYTVIVESGALAGRLAERCACACILHRIVFGAWCMRRRLHIAMSSAPIISTTNQSRVQPDEAIFIRAK